MGDVLTLGDLCQKLNAGDSFEDFKEKTGIEVPALVQLSGKSTGNSQASGFQTIHHKPSNLNVTRFYERFEQPVYPLVSKPDSPFQGTIISLGRTPNNDVVIDDETVSKTCLVFLNSCGAWYVENRATAGTFVECRLDEDNHDKSFSMGWPEGRGSSTPITARELTREEKVGLDDKLRICIAGPLGYRFEYYTPEGLYGLVRQIKK